MICLRPLSAIALSCAISLPVPAQAAGCATDAMLVFDGSASMAELGFDASAPTRIEDARRAVRRAMPQIAPVRRVGLLTYGSGAGDACDTIALRFAPRPDASDAVIAGIEALAPTGLTPLAASVAAAADVLDHRIRPGIVVLVTDGNETCGGRPCALGAVLAAESMDLTVHVIGFRVVADPFVWDSPEAGVYSDGASVAKCLADQTGGMYVPTETVEELAAALEETLGCAMIGALSPRYQKFEGGAG